MRKRYISILLTAALLMGPVGRVESYASQVSETTLPEGVVSEVYETVSVPSEDSQPEEPVQETEASVPAQEEKELPEGVIQQVIRTEPVEQVRELPEGVVQEVYETVPVEDTAPSAEALGQSSMPDEAELDIHAEDVVSMVMPVIPEGTYDFTLDPQDLLSRYSIYKEDYEQSSIYFNNSAGEKPHTGMSDAAMAKNKSSVPVLLYVSLEVVNEYGWDVTYTDMESVEGDDNNNLAFSLVPVSLDEETGEQVSHNDHSINIDETGKADMILFFSGSQDNFDQIGDKYVAKEDAVWTSLGFAVAGKCNTKGDWQDIDERSREGETIKLHITYRMDALTEEQKEKMENGVTPDPVTGIISFDTGIEQE